MAAAWRAREVAPEETALLVLQFLQSGFPESATTFAREAAPLDRARAAGPARARRARAEPAAREQHGAGARACACTTEDSCGEAAQMWV